MNTEINMNKLVEIADEYNDGRLNATEFRRDLALAIIVLDQDNTDRLASYLEQYIPTYD